MSVSERVALFGAGLDLAIAAADSPGGALPDDPKVPEGVDLKRTDLGFVLRQQEVTALGRTMKPEFGGFGLPPEIR